MGDPCAALCSPDPGRLQGSIAMRRCAECGAAPWKRRRDGPAEQKAEGGFLFLRRRQIPKPQHFFWGSTGGDVERGTRGVPGEARPLRKAWTAQQGETRTSSSIFLFPADESRPSDEATLLTPAPSLTLFPARFPDRRSAMQVPAHGVPFPCLLRAPRASLVNGTAGRWNLPRLPGVSHTSTAALNSPFFHLCPRPTDAPAHNSVLVLKNHGSERPPGKRSWGK